MLLGIFGITTDGAKSGALFAILALVAVAVISALVVKAVVTKVLTMLISALLAFGVYSQRSSITSCADKVKKEALSFGARKTECSFFGVKVNVPTDQLPSK